jgi:predicted ATPase
VLKTVSIQHYKSLADAQINLSPITVLVGPNGSGKSNLVDALRFVRDAMVHDLDHAISERGGIDVIRQYSPTKPYTISFRLEFEYALENTENKYPAYYAFRLAGTGGEYRVESEDASWSETAYEINGEQLVELGVRQHTFHRDKHGGVLLDDKDVPQKWHPGRLGIRRFLPTEPFINQSAIAQRLGGMKFAAIYPNIMREPSRPDADKVLKENCVNWASVLKAMRQTRPGDGRLRRVMEFMRQLMPNLENVTVKQVGGYVVPQFLVKDSPRQNSHFFDPVQLSDGTLRIFGLLLALYQLPPPKFLAMEEPEQTMHPGVLGMLVEAFREVSKRTQLLITTHSPYILDHFDPKEIRVVSMDGGESHIAPIRKSQVDTIKQKLMSISEIMALDGLRSELR